MSRTANQNGADESIRFFAFDSAGDAVEGLDFESDGLEISVVIRSKGRIVSVTPATVVARTGAGVHTDSAMAEVGGGEYVFDLSDAVLTTSDVVVSLDVTATDITGTVIVETVTVVAAAASAAAGDHPLASNG